MPGLVNNIASNAALNVINTFERRIRGKGAKRAGKEFTLVISNEDIGNNIEIKMSLEDSNVLMDGVTEATKYDIKRKNNVDLLLICQHLWLFQLYNL